jgi:Winged helix DNA-binding domain
MDHSPRNRSRDLLERRALNRATLERQLLLGRRDLPVVEAVGRLAGLNAQDPEPPYLALWARLAGFEREHLTRAMEDRSLVRGSLLRATQHMVTAADYLAWRPLLQPVLERSRRTFRLATAGIDPAELAAAARRLLAERPLTRPELGRLLAERWPGREPGPLAWSAQFLLPLVHPPPSGTWGVRGPTPFVLATDWLGRPLADPPAPDDLVVRHLAAFGPASVADIQAWSGLTRLREPVERLGGRLRRFRDEHGRELFDLPDAPRPDPATPAPPRFLPPFDNLLLAHADRTRVMTDDHRRRVSYGAVVEPTVLVDGQVAAIWRLVRDPGRVTLEIEPLDGVPATALSAATDEGERLLAFAAEDAADHDLRVVAAGRPPPPGSEARPPGGGA